MLEVGRERPVHGPDGPTITVFRLQGAEYEVEGRHGPGAAVELDLGVARLILDPADLLA